MWNTLLFYNNAFFIFSTKETLVKRFILIFYFLENTIKADGLMVIYLANKI